MLLSNVFCVMSRLLRKSKDILTDYNFISSISSLDISSNLVCHAAVSCKARMQHCSLLVGHQSSLQRLAWRVRLDYLVSLFPKDPSGCCSNLGAHEGPSAPMHRSGSSKEVSCLSVQLKHSIQPFSGSVSIKDILFIAYVSSNTPCLVPENKNTSTHQRKREKMKLQI
jgi:hypothetical protein